jgi:predicted transcriptional regulator
MVVAERARQMKSESIVKLPEVFDLNSYEANSYLALLEKDTLTAVEVAKISGVPRGRIYEILNNLLEKGFCHSIPGKVKQYKASNPDFLHEMLKSKLKSIEAEIEQEAKEFDAEIERKKQEFNSEIEKRRRKFESDIEKRKHKFDLEIERKKQNNNSKIERKKQELHLLEKNNDGVIKKLAGVYKKSRGNDNPLDYIEIMRESYLMNKRIAELVAETENEVLNFMKPPFFKRLKETVKERSEIESDLLKKNVVIRVVYEIPEDVEEIEWLYEEIDMSIRDGEKAKVIDKLPMKMIVFDEKIAMFEMIDPLSTNKSITVQFVRHQALAQSLKMLFESVWVQAQDYHILKGLKK